MFVCHSVCVCVCVCLIKCDFYSSYFHFGEAVLTTDIHSGHRLNQTAVLQNAIFWRIVRLGVRQSV